MESSSGKEEFLKQLQNIMEGVRQNRFKIEKQVSEEKKKRDQLAGSLQVSFNEISQIDILKRK